VFSVVIHGKTRHFDTPLKGEMIWFDYFPSSKPAANGKSYEEIAKKPSQTRTLLIISNHGMRERY
jgi:hypothetical protein